MGRPDRCASAGDGANDQRDRELAAGHVPDLGGVVHDLVHGQKAEVDGHQLDHGTQAGHGRAHAGADDDRFGQGGVLDAFLPVLLPETLGDGEGAAVGSDVLPHEEDALILIQGFAEN